MPQPSARPPPSARPWRPFPAFLLRATGMPLAWLVPPSGAPVWEVDEDGYGAALARARGDMVRLLDEALIEDALFLSNPSLGPARVDAWRRSLIATRRRSKQRRRERAIWRYLQRFCAKNDTTSFFGATSLGRFDDPAPGDDPVVLPIASVRRAFLEHWAVEALLDAAAEDLEARGEWVDRPRRAANVTVAGARVSRREGSQVQDRWEGASFAAAAHLADGAQSTGALAAAVSDRADVSRAEAGASIATMMSDGGLEPAHAAAAGAPDALGDAHRVLARQPEGDARESWLGHLDAIQTDLERFGEERGAALRARFAGLEARFAAATGRSARRAPGSFYAARTIVHEVGDRSGEPIRLPRALTDAVVMGLQPLCELGALHTLVDRLTFRAWFTSTLGPGEHAFTGVMKAYREAGAGFYLAAPREARALASDLAAVRDDLRAQADAHLAEYGPERPLTLEPAAFDAIRTRWEALLEAEPAYASPDVLLGDRRREEGGGIDMVVGDIHSMPYLTPALFAAAPEATAVWEETRRWLARLVAPATPALLAAERGSFMAFEPDLGQISLEVDARAPIPHERRAALSDLRFVPAPDGDGLRLEVTTGAGERREVVPLVRSANTVSTFSRLVQLGARVYPARLVNLGAWLEATDWRRAEELPRLLWGNPDPALGIVAARRRWRVPSQAWASPGPPREALRRLAEATGGALPRLCFVLAPAEPKPLFVDWANPIAAEAILAVARREVALTMVEMLPGPEGLWLAGPDGRHTSELRVVFARSTRASWDAESLVGADERETMSCGSSFREPEPN